jgi:hypothetical protein
MAAPPGSRNRRDKAHGTPDALASGGEAPAGGASYAPVQLGEEELELADAGRRWGGRGGRDQAYGLSGPRLLLADAAPGSHGKPPGSL